MRKRSKKVKARGLWLAQAVQLVPGHPGLHKEILLPNSKKTNKTSGSIDMFL